jgi:hypothetical protein
MQSAERGTLSGLGFREFYLCYFFDDVKREISFILDIKKDLHISIALHRSISVHRFSAAYGREMAAWLMGRRASSECVPTQSMGTRKTNSTNPINARNPTNSTNPRNATFHMMPVPDPGNRPPSTHA